MTAAVAQLDWQTQPACRGARNDLFFPADGAVPSPVALGMCGRCPIKDECLDWALSHEEFGIWGGLTEAQRRAINARRHRVRCPDCRSDNVIEEGRHEVCISCGLSWPV